MIKTSEAEHFDKDPVQIIDFNDWLDHCPVQWFRLELDSDKVVYSFILPNKDSPDWPMNTSFTRPELAALRVLIKTRIKRIQADRFDDQDSMVGSTSFWEEILQKLT